MTPMQLAAYLAAALRADYRRRTEATMARIKEAGADYAVSVSWGKDSVVMLDLAARSLGKVVAVHGRYSENEELPDIPKIRDAVLARLGGAVDYIEVPVWGDWEIFERAGRFFLSPETTKERALLAEWKREFVAEIEGAAQRAGCRGMMIGMAGHESHGRKMNIVARGDSYCASGRLPTLLPLARWRADDVVAYHVANNLPWLKIYDVAEDPRRARSEFAFAAGGGDAIRRHGAWENWRTAYPELWRIWQARWITPTRTAENDQSSSRAISSTVSR
jgi:3'-phosphoadenosine 5'-phosphosulfate sulfotransferase (PAPS reductase)/FAD synthetase